jgi:hypothetical protein
MMNRSKPFALLFFVLVIVILLCCELFAQGSSVSGEGTIHLSSESVKVGAHQWVMQLDNQKSEGPSASNILEMSLSSHTALSEFRITKVEKNNFATNITSGLQEYNLTFEETGLPMGTVWTITVNGMSKSSNLSQITFIETNGTYNYEVGLVNGFTVSQLAGQLPISGRSVTVHILYSELYAVTFSEFGLPVGTKWSIAFNGSQKSTVAGSGSIHLAETNGTYPYTINLPENYTTFPTTGNVVINGTPVFKSIQFELYTITLTGSVSPTNASMYINGRQVQVVNGVFTITLDAGQKYEIEVKYPGYENYYYNMTVTSKTLPTILINISLSKIQNNYPQSYLSLYLVVIGVVTFAIIMAMLRSTMRSKKAQ